MRQIPITEAKYKQRRQTVTRLPVGTGHSNSMAFGRYACANPNSHAQLLLTKSCICFFLDASSAVRVTGIESCRCHVGGHKAGPLLAQSARAVEHILEGHLRGRLCSRFTCQLTWYFIRLPSLHSVFARSADFPLCANLLPGVRFV